MLMTTLIRVCLAVLFLDELIVGAWNAISPGTFYVHFPTVDTTPPFSDHYARDFGGATLGIAFLLGLAIVKPRSQFVIPAAIAFSVFAVPHFFYHVGHLAHATASEAVGLTTANAIVALLGIVVIPLTVARDRRSRGPLDSGEPSSLN
ncbi:MAG: hypothetical protein K0S70_2623 [Microbacterium sp.]|jgi:hypothetical protein|nr:hypothetical protein [Microbacterium sp.]